MSLIKLFILIVAGTYCYLSYGVDITLQNLTNLDLKISLTQKTDSLLLPQSYGPFAVAQRRATPPLQPFILKKGAEKNVKSVGAQDSEKIVKIAIQKIKPDANETIGSSQSLNIQNIIKKSSHCVHDDILVTIVDGKFWGFYEILSCKKKSE